MLYVAQIEDQLSQSLIESNKETSESLLSVLLVILLFTLAFSHLFESLSVCSANEVGLHIVDSPLRVHQVLIILTFNLNHPHNNSVNHIYWFAFFFTFQSLIFILFAINFLVLDVIVIIILRLTVHIILVLVTTACPLLVELLLWTEPDRNLQVFNYLNHFLFIHEVICGKLSLLNDAD